ncbi:ADP-ribosyltransferase [Vibrio tubiashii]|uniref:ADP-ribosyltransferase n=1 Tax=Vibrio tubiashii TaxID=29498 RepID=UPI001EFDB60E|nr:ADP-ribosyltransferase [Vibrio tubiashii]MCG9582242.1 ADP-ribosyltransferase [Vibrio tubiashii]MCG9615833.1 ADP-ribosyltransferase [Vibrio tubiashii]MCG9686849.1 ADP-ribosyltransferase [Vibrio tubiashii]
MTHLNATHSSATQVANVSNHQTELSAQTGALGDKPVTSIATPKEVQQLAERTESSPRTSLKDKVISWLSGAANAIKGLFVSKDTPVSSMTPTGQTQQLSREEMGKVALKESLNGLTQLDTLSSLDGESLKQQHRELATNNGALRSTVTALQTIKLFGTETQKTAASNILSDMVGGQPFQQWATTGSGEAKDASTFLNDASSEELQAASDKINQLSVQISKLKDELIDYLQPQQTASASEVKPANSIESRYEADNDLGIGGGRSAKDNSVKTALDAVSFLATKVAPSTTSTLSSESINALQDAIADGTVSFSMIQNSALNKGDLAMIRELALSTVSNQDASYTGELGSIVDSLSHSRSNAGTVMQGIQGFIDMSASQWHAKTADKPEDAIDANAHAKFDRELMKSSFDGMSQSDLKQALAQLEGDFGQNLRGIMGLVAEKVPVSDDAQENPVLISSAMRYGNVIEGLITALKEKLGEPTDTRFADAPMISDLSELTAFEKAALLRVGITEEMMA